MSNFKTKDTRIKFRNSSNSIEDFFVGVHFNESEIEVVFPLGYRISEDYIECRKDSIKLINILKKYSLHDGFIAKSSFGDLKNTEFPIDSYLYLINHHLIYGYYIENEPTYLHKNSGKIVWSKTIRSITPKMANMDPLYLDFVTKNTIGNEETWISLVYEFCIFQSFKLLGWLYTEYIPRTPRFYDFDRSAYKSIIQKKMNETFNDRLRLLLDNMLQIIGSYDGHEVPIGFSYGTTRFEYVWESIVDSCFGNIDKRPFLPRTYWTLKNGTIKENSFLYPDTIIFKNGSYFIVDAKYYKYGVTGNSRDLPDSSSINKQVIYGEYIYEKFGMDKSVKIYNAFVLPYSSNKDLDNKNIIRIAEAITDWRSSLLEHTRIQAILVDVKYLIEEDILKTNKAVNLLCNEIKSAFIS